MLLELTKKIHWYFWIDQAQRAMEVFDKINLRIDSTVMMVNTSNPLRIYDVYGSPVRTDRIAGLWRQDTQELVMDKFWNFIQGNLTSISRKPQNPKTPAGLILN